MASPSYTFVTACPTSTLSAMATFSCSHSRISASRLALASASGAEGREGGREAAQMQWGGQGQGQLKPGGARGKRESHSNMAGPLKDCSPAL